MKKYTVNESFFEKIDTQEKAYAFGVLLSDGCIINSKSYASKYICFDQLIERIDILEQIKRSLNTDYPIHRTLLGSKITCRLQICSNKMFNDLVKLGVTPKKSLTVCFPTFIKDDLMPHFIRGLFDGDGCVWNGKRKKMLVKKENKPGEYRERIVHNVKFTYTGNYNFVLMFQNYLVEKLNFNRTKLNFSKAKNPNTPTKQNVCTMEYSGRKNIKKLYDFMYCNATIFCQEKKTKFDLICAFDEKSSNETELIAGNPLEP